jgi:hypothetical protein
MKGIGYSGLAAMLLVGLAAPAWEQTALPLSVEKCRKDAELFRSDDAVDLPTSVNLTNQADEMHACAELDEENWPRYHKLFDKFLMADSLRLQDFLSRHNLWAQFYAEDEAGKR